MGVIAVVLSALNFVGLPFIHLVGLGMGIAGLIISKDERKHSSYKESVVLNTLAICLAVLAIIIGTILYILEN